ncbi:uncharacterized protein BO97DRAFT_288215 [Aspergillus homomorphus CBS 101889]|uniref:Uncharacterized protein n=1 Tax=Aspergillus homomorphus (strain CBS 101889) TaxID=1450537 RepID=A0A395HHL1_ASPHC|nr:hypothetical protein BO97DRAFT_288215 [Aspergillus homomorphus CBS 101889]RAL06655.1 hypothetical protein BO97DRAFT_288215 [Aspergillus homomorphus CBS 101889]
MRPPTIPNPVSSHSTSPRRRISPSAQPVQQCAQPPYLGAGIPKLLLAPRGAEPLCNCPVKASIPSIPFLFILPSPVPFPPPSSSPSSPHIVIPLSPYLFCFPQSLFSPFPSPLLNPVLGDGTGCDPCDFGIHFTNSDRRNR